MIRVSYGMKQVEGVVTMPIEETEKLIPAQWSYKELDAVNNYYMSASISLEWTPDNSECYRYTASNNNGTVASGYSPSLDDAVKALDNSINCFIKKDARFPGFHRDKLEITRFLSAHNKRLQLSKTANGRGYIQQHDEQGNTEVSLYLDTFDKAEDFALEFSSLLKKYRG